MDQVTASAERPSAAPIPAEDRARLIAELSSQPMARHAVPWRGGYLKAPVIVLAEGLLVYRLENGRLIAELREQSHKGGADLLASPDGQETLEVQRLLHGLLVTKAGDPQGPILQELERLGTQTEPLLITADGVVVNGNRRLASMRELLARDPARYGAFAEVAAAVLPACGPPNRAPRSVKFSDREARLARRNRRSPRRSTVMSPCRSLRPTRPLRCRIT